MPDLSALNIKDSSFNNSLINDSHHFNIDDILIHKINKETSNDKTVADIKSRHNINAFRLNNLTEKLADLNAFLITKSNLDEQELQGVIGLMRDLSATCEKSVQNINLYAQRNQKTVLIEELKQKNLSLRKLISRQIRASKKRG